MMTFVIQAGDRFCREVSQSQLSSIEKGMKEPMLRPQWFSDGKASVNATCICCCMLFIEESNWPRLC